MSRSFQVKPSCHGNPSIEAHDLTLKECRTLRGIITNNYTPSDDYKIMRPTGAFLQGYEEPYNGHSNDGWALVEFWTDDAEDIQRAVDYVNRVFAEEKAT